MDRMQEDLFTQLYQDYHKLILNICAKRLGDFEEAQEVSQEVFIIAFNKINQLNPEGNLAAWLSQVARYKCNDVFRHRKVITFVAWEPSFDDWFEAPFISPERLVEIKERLCETSLKNRPWNDTNRQWLGGHRLVSPREDLLEIFKYGGPLTAKEIFIRWINKPNAQNVTYRAVRYWLKILSKEGVIKPGNQEKLNPKTRSYPSYQVV